MIRTLLLCFTILFALNCEKDKDKSVQPESENEIELVSQYDGLLVIEAESIDMVTPWQVKTDQPGYNGDGYIQAVFGEPKSKKIDHSKTLGVMAYPFEIEKAGEYRILMRVSIPYEDITENNDIFLKVDNLKDVNHAVEHDFWQKAATNGFVSYPDGFHWDEGGKSQTWNVHFQFEGPHQIRYNLTAGSHDLFIAARSPWFIIDTIFIFDNSKWSEYDLLTGQYEQ